MKLFLLGCNLLVTLFIAGCGGGNDGKPSQPNQAPPTTVSLQVTPAQGLVPVGLEQQLIAQAMMSDGTVQNVTADSHLSWSSSEPSIASITRRGLVTGVTPGDVTITATRTVDGTPVRAAVQFAVTDAVVTALQLTPATTSIPVGLEHQFTATAQLSDGSALDVTNNSAVSWTSSHPAIATISNLDGSKGVVTGAAAGAVTITATAIVNGEAITASAELTVTDAVVTALQLTPATTSIPVGLEHQFTATAQLSDGSVLDVTNDSAVSWTSSHPAIATISNLDGRKGVVTGGAAGAATITATGIVNGEAITASAELTVTDAVMTSLQLTPASTSVAVGLTHQFTATALLSDGGALNVTNDSAVSWTSSHPAIATISNLDGSKGVVTGAAAGAVTITATAIVNGEAITASAELTVTDAVMTSLQLTPASTSVAVGLTHQFTATALLSDGGALDVTNDSAVSWTSSHPAIATISNLDGSKGLATGGAAGAATITATGIVNGEAITASAELTVTDSVVITQFNVDTQSTAGGHVSPSSLRVDAGKQGSFTVTADPGFVLDNISGCDGDLIGNLFTTAAMTAECTISAAFITNAEHAIAKQDHRLASDAELIAHARGFIADSEGRRKTLIGELYQGIGQLSWHPTHDSITFATFTPETTMTALPSNVDGSGNPAVRGLVMLSEQDQQRWGAMGANLFAVGNTAETDILLQRLIHWLTKDADQRDGFSVVTAQIPSEADSWYFPHNEKIRSWLNTHYPDAHRINAANACDYNALSSCIDNQKPDLIILSDIDRQGLGYQGIASAMAKAKAAGIPVLLSNYNREASGMLSPLYQVMGLTIAGNYWSKLNANNLNVETIKANDQDLTAIDSLLVNLGEGRFDTAVLNACSGNYINCNDAGFYAAFKHGADWMRNAAVTLDVANTSLFTLAGGDVLKASVLLADKYRSAIDYPITFDDGQHWQQAMFADWLINYARPNNPAQPDLGEFVTDQSKVDKGSNAHYAYPATETERKTITVPYKGQWTTTGWYALPGQTITLTRNDATDTRVEVKLNYHRSNTNRAYEQKRYLGPLELATQRLRLTKGSSISFSSPYGGPVYLYLDGSDSELAVDVTASGIAHHPTIMNFSDEAQIRFFEQLMATTELPHVDLRNVSAEQHLRRDRFEGAIGGGIADVRGLLDSVSRDHINTVYTLAGFKIQGELADTLPVDVKTACLNLLGSDCLDPKLHTRETIQHANYDQNAQCGTGCSGNPWDASWNISPTGWGDNHELGHNLQTGSLNVNYAAPADADNWPGYSNRAGENSNNIFPYVAKWRAHYIRDNNTGSITDDHMNHKDLFYVFMSDAAKVTDTQGNRVVLGANCKVLDVGADRYMAPWASNAYAVNNGYRMAFYIQMALRAHGMQLSDGTVLANGFNIYTLLYQHSRIFGKYADSIANWEANRDWLGFNLFPYEGHTVYGGRKVKDIPGNDFMLVSLSKLTGVDWRSHFDLMGLRYSSLASAQVIANATKGSLPMGMYVLETDLPPANMSQGLRFLPLSETDGNTRWQDGSSPAECPKP